jgi:NADH:ubiquinone oxidoreductase subunit D
LDHFCLIFNQALKTISQTTEFFFGDKLMRRYIRLGGVAHDLDDISLGQLEKRLDEFLERWLEDSELFSSRTGIEGRLKGLGVVTPHLAKIHSLTGPSARALDLAADLRQPSLSENLVYSHLNYTPVCEAGGDAWDRLMVHVREVTESIGLIKQCCRQISFGHYFVEIPIAADRLKDQRTILFEGARGQISMTVTSNRRPNLEKISIQTPDQNALSVFLDLVKGAPLEDFFLLYISMDILPQTIRP